MKVPLRLIRSGANSERVGDIDQSRDPVAEHGSRDGQQDDNEG